MSVWEYRVLSRQQKSALSCNCLKPMKTYVQPAPESGSFKATRRRYILVACVILTGVLLSLYSFTRPSTRHPLSGSETRSNFRLFSKFGLNRLSDFPWYGTSDFGNDTLNDVKARGTKKTPKALIIGAKKAGTRALLEFIRVHPNVRAAGHEIHFFDKNYSKGCDWYRKMMPTSIEGQITIEKTPSYFVSPEVPERVKLLDPNMKLIIVVKDPVERAISDYTQSFSKHRRKKPFEEYVFSDAESLEVNETRVPISTGLYARHLKNWQKYFPLEQICFINGETLVKDPAAEMRKLQSFLGLKQVITEEHFYFNSTKGFPCLRKRDASGAPHCLGDGKGRVHPKVPTRALAALYKFFEPSNMELYRISGIDFGWEEKNPLKKGVP